MTEHDKYAKGATKPGGFAAQGFYGGLEASKQQQQVRAFRATLPLHARAPLGATAHEQRRRWMHFTGGGGGVPYGCRLTLWMLP